MSEVTHIARAWNDRPIYTRATILGLVLIALATLMVLIVQPIEGNTKSLAFSVPIFLIPLAIATLVWKYGSWLLIVAAVADVLGLVNAVPFLDYGIANPHSFFDFIPNVLNIVGALIALGAGVTAYIRDRRGDSRAVATGTEIGSNSGHSSGVGGPGRVLDNSHRQPAGHRECPGQAAGHSYRHGGLRIQARQHNTPGWHRVPRGNKEPRHSFAYFHDQ